MHGNGIGARLAKRFQVAFRLDDHEVYVDLEPRNSANRFEDGYPKTEIGNEDAVHNVKMQSARPGGFRAPNLVFEPREIRGQKGRDDIDAVARELGGPICFGHNVFPTTLK